MLVRSNVTERLCGGENGGWTNVHSMAVERVPRAKDDI